MKKVVGFAGSNSSRSINRALVNYASSLLQDASVEILDLNQFEMPLYSIDREEQDGIPKEAHLFREKMQSSDGILCSMAEHNRSYTAAFKNLFDWCSRIDLNIFSNRPMLLMSTSPGRYGGGNVMAAAKSFFPNTGANVIETFSLPSFYDNFKTGKLTNNELSSTLNSCITKFEQALLIPNE